MTASLVAWIAEGLRNTGKSKRGLAEALGRQPSAVTALLKGERTLKAQEMPAVARYLGLEIPESLLGMPEARAVEDPVEIAAFVARIVDLDDEDAEFVLRFIARARAAARAQTGASGRSQPANSRRARGPSRSRA